MVVGAPPGAAVLGAPPGAAGAVPEGVVVVVVAVLGLIAGVVGVVAALAPAVTCEPVVVFDVVPPC